MFLLHNNTILPLTHKCVFLCHSPPFTVRRQLKQRSNHSLHRPQRQPLPLPVCPPNGLSVVLPTGQSAAGSQLPKTNAEVEYLWSVSSFSYFQLFIILFSINSVWTGAQVLYIFVSFSKHSFLLAWKKSLTNTHPTGSTSRDPAHPHGTPKGQKVRSECGWGGWKNSRQSCLGLLKIWNQNVF